jgi:hypothetical protein
MNVQSPDTDPTWHVTPLPSQPKSDTLHRSTIRTGVADAGPTVRTPLPSVLSAPGATSQTQVEARSESSSTGAILIVCAVILIAAAAIIVVLLRRPAQSQVASAQTASVATQAPTPAPVRSHANVDVVSPAPITITTTATETVSPPAPVLTQPATTTTQTVVSQPIRPKPAPVVREPPKEPEPKPAPAPAPAPVRAYVEGGDSDVNDQLMSDAKRHLSGVKSITVHANSDMQKQLTDYPKSEASDVTIGDGADTVVDFNGTIERLGRGKKRRSAQATVTRNGRVVLRYEMPPEEYRIGDTPAEAFAKVLVDALH